MIKIAAKKINAVSLFAAFPPPRSRRRWEPL
jgi:hypothetical protein